MPRTTAPLIKLIMDVDASIVNFAPFILTANLLVTEACSTAGYTDERLELIERWLSAHFLSIRDKPVSSETAGPITSSYELKIGLGLKASMYGQQALILDSKGGLAKIDKKIQAGGVPTFGVAWVGSTVAEARASRVF